MKEASATFKTSPAHVLGSAAHRYLAVCWDMDGTLADSEPLHQRTLAAVLRTVGVEAQFALFDDTVGLADHEVHALCVDRFGLTIAMKDWVAVRHVAYARESLALQPRAGAVDVLRRLGAGGLTQAIVSNSCRTVLDLSVRGLGLHDLALASVSRDDVEYPKPHAQPYLRAATLLGLDARDVLVVEDSPVGAKAGLAAGMRVIAWPAPGLTTADFPSGCHGVDSPEALHAFIASTTRSVP